MCGVAAVSGVSHEEKTRRSVEKMRHRGIRSTVSPGSGSSIGHVRLPIVGVGEDNDQPVKRGGWTVAFVGEVLDFRERDPKAECDIDLVVKTWVERGPQGFTDFDGFWSVVARDDRDGSIHALVDYLSQKPLYVRDDGVVRAVASEPDAVSCLGPIELDQIYLSSVVKWGYCPETWRTPYVGVRRMTPGEYAVIPVKGPIQWSRTDVLHPLSSTPGSLSQEIENAVRRRVTSSDVPVACLVSGGLDSSMVLSIARRYGDIRTYHVENGEWESCKLIAPEATTLGLTSVDLVQGLRYMREPLDLGSLLPQVALSDAIGRTGGERVCLTGDGADELFGGYGRSARYDSQASDVWHELVAWHLPRLDRVMMRNQIEVRSPFLARRVAGMALGLPYRNRVNKIALRNSARPVLPTEICDGVKRPLRTSSVESDREGRSQELVRMFIDNHKESNYAYT